MLTTDPSPRLPKTRHQRPRLLRLPAQPPCPNRPPWTSAPPQRHPPGQASGSPRAHAGPAGTNPPALPFLATISRGPQDPTPPGAHSLQWAPRHHGLRPGSSPLSKQAAPPWCPTWLQPALTARPSTSLCTDLGRAHSRLRALAHATQPQRFSSTSLTTAPPRPTTTAQRWPHTWDVSTVTGPRRLPCLDRVSGVRGCRLGPHRPRNAPPRPPARWMPGAQLRIPRAGVGVCLPCPAPQPAAWPPSRARTAPPGAWRQRQADHGSHDSSRSTPWRAGGRVILRPAIYMFIQSPGKIRNTVTALGL